MKTLYISDLDGTLLNSEALLSEATVSGISKLINAGIYFSFATARTAETAIKMTCELPLNLPVILMNGVCIYDVTCSQYLNVHKIEPAAAKSLIDILKKHNQTGFLFKLENNQRLLTYYENLDTPHMKDFHDERVRKFNKKFLQTPSFYDCINTDIIYFSIADKLDTLQPIFNELQQIDNVHVEFYRDTYEPDFWYMEVCSNKASKLNAVNYLREQYSFDHIICFGDNLNDIPMFCASNESYAVSNAKEEVKSKASGIIESNNDDGVVKWLLKNCEV